MNNKELVVFGCSHTKWPPFLTWADVIEINGTPIINYAKPGCGNLQILMQLIKHNQIYGFENKTIIVQTTYFSRLFDYYMSKLYFNKEKFDVNFSLIKNKNITNLDPEMNIADYFDDYNFTIITSIHNFLIQNSLEFYYCQIEKYGQTINYNQFLSFQECFKIPNVDIRHISEKCDLYKNIKYPIPNDGHMNLLQHLEVAKKIIEHLNLPQISQQALDIVNNIHQYFCTTEIIDLNILEKLKNNLRP